jgi:hypothetical protein
MFCLVCHVILSAIRFKFCTVALRSCVRAAPVVSYATQLSTMLPIIESRNHVKAKQRKLRSGMPVYSWVALNQSSINQSGINQEVYS